MYNVNDYIQLVAILSVITAIVYGIMKYVHDYFRRKSVKREMYYKSFDRWVTQLSSNVKTSQLSAAILLRRYFNKVEMDNLSDLRIEAISVISSLLKILPTGVLQKTLGDGLAYAEDLNNVDLQNTNLQNLYLGRKDGIHIKMQNTDMFAADLSYATLNEIDGQGAVFVNSILYRTRIKDCNFTGASFFGADLSNAFFRKVTLKDADFTYATNIPKEIQEHLIDNKFVYEKSITTYSTNIEKKVIFFSMPGCLSKKDEMITKDYYVYLTNLGYDVLWYNKDEYPEFGQFNKIRHSILNSSAMIAFGFKQINIEKGISRPNTSEEKPIANKYLSTPWNELEVGMGLMANLPILLVKDPDIDNGVFDSKLSEVFVASTTVNYDARELDYNPALKTWLAAF